MPAAPSTDCDLSPETNPPALSQPNRPITRLFVLMRKKYGCDLDPQLCNVLGIRAETDAAASCEPRQLCREPCELC